MKNKPKNKPSKKSIPIGAKRITNADGKRVWFYDGKEYFSKRELVEENPDKVS